MVTWGPHPGKAPFDSVAQAAMEEGLKGHAYVKVFDGAYVVKLLFGREEREEIVKVLRDQMAKPEGPKGRLLVSPPIPANSGLFNGAAPQEVWKALNRLSQENDAT